MLIYYLQMIESEEDRSKFEELYVSYKGFMYHIAYSVLRNPEDSEDAVHLAFLSVLKYIKTIKDTKSRDTQAYLAVITKRKAIDILRKKSNIQAVEFDEAYIGAETMVTADDAIAKAIAKLPAKDRHVLILKYHSGYSIREIAKMLDSDYSAMQKAIWRAKKKLEEILKEEGV